MNPKIKIIFVGDVHLSERNPLARRDDYNEAILKKLEQVYALALEQKVSAVVFLGDMFHLKAPSKNSFKLVNRLVKYLRRFWRANIPVILLVGNHDLMYGDLASIPRQPIGILREMDGIFTNLRLGAEGMDINLTGLDFSNEPMDKQLEYIQSIPRIAKYNVVCVHTNIVSGDTLFKEAGIKLDEITNTNIDLIVNGHIHFPTIIGHNKSDIIYVQPGAISRGTLDTENLSRDVNIVMIGFDENGIKHKVIKLDIEPAEKVFDLTKRRSEKEVSSKVESFVESLSQFANVKATGDDFISFLAQMDLDNNVKELVTDYLSGGCINVDSL